MSFYGVQLDVQTRRIIHDMKMKFSKVAAGLEVRKIGKLFRSLDQVPNGTISEFEFEETQKTVSIVLRKNDIQVLWKYFQTDVPTRVNYRAFQDFFRNPLSVRAKKHLHEVFAFLDDNASESLDPQEITNHICDAVLYEMKLCNGSRDDMLDAFFHLFDKDGNGQIEYSEFEKFYDDMNSQITSDEVFCRHQTRMWGVPEGDSAEISLTYVRGIISQMRQKLIARTQGVQDEFLLIKLNREFETTRTHSHNDSFNLHELDQLLIKIGLPLCEKYLNAVFAFFDKEKNGFVKYDDFEKHLIFNPYK